MFWLSRVGPHRNHPARPVADEPLRVLDWLANAQSRRLHDARVLRMAAGVFNRAWGVTGVVVGEVSAASAALGPVPGRTLTQVASQHFSESQ